MTGLARPPVARLMSKIEFLLSCEKKTPKPVRNDHFADGL